MSIADLPNELLLAIFENLLNSSSPSFANPPSRISEVCRLWRSQSLLIPDLRTVLPLVTLGPTSRTLRGPLNTNAALSFAMRGVSSRHKKNRPKLNDAFSFLESGRGSAQDACQVLLSCVYVPLHRLSQSEPTSESLRDVPQRAKSILQQLDGRFGQLSVGWRSENEVTLIRTGPPRPASIASLLEAERANPQGLSDSKTTVRSGGRAPPWGFVDLTQPIGVRTM